MDENHWLHGPSHVVDFAANSIHGNMFTNVYCSVLVVARSAVQVLSPTTDDRWLTHVKQHTPCIKHEADSCIELWFSCED